MENSCYRHYLENNCLKNYNYHCTEIILFKCMNIKRCYLPLRICWLNFVVVFWCAADDISVDSTVPRSWERPWRRTRRKKLSCQLGTRQHCRDNVTMFSGQKMIDYLDNEALIFLVFSCHWSSITLLHCRCRKAKKLSRVQLCPFINWPLSRRQGSLFSTLESIWIRKRDT